jgi:signal transduction histidine kinase
MLVASPDGGLGSNALQLDSIFRGLLVDGPLVRVKIWDEDGAIVYSDDRRLVGLTFPLGEHALSVLESGSPHAHPSDRHEPEHQFEVSADKLLEVYVPLRGPTGERFLFESYFSYDSVSAESRQIWLLFAPVLLLGLLALEAVQFPLAWSMARRLEKGSRERYRLLAELEAQSERERIARDLHDDTMQSIYGAGLSLQASASTPEATKEDVIAEASQNLNAVIADLRRYMDGLTNESRSAVATRPLVDRVRALLVASGTGPEWRMDSSGEPVAGQPAEQLHLVAKELVSNANRHSGASEATVSLHHRGAFAHLIVRDNGVGFDLDAARQNGGLRGVRSRVAQLGGRLSVRSTVGAGTTVHVAVPVYRGAASEGAGGQA